MKKILNKLPLYTLAALSLQSCVKLEQEPFNELSEQKSFLNVEDAQYWVNGMYDGLRDNTYGNTMYSSDVQADFLNAVRRNNEILPELHRWTDFTSSNSTTAAIWMAHYRAIQDINIALNGIPKVPIAQERERRCCQSAQGTCATLPRGMARGLYYGQISYRWRKIPIGYHTECFGGDLERG